MEPISLLLGTFTTLVDRIINLKKARLQDKKDLFNGIVKPLFDELEPVASNYMEIFRNAKKLVANASPEKMRDEIVSIENERNSIILTRIKVREMADQITVFIKDEDVVRFAEAIHDFFFEATHPTSSRTYWLVMHLVSADPLSVEKIKELNLYIDENLTGLEKTWGEIVRNYEILKIHSVSAPGLVQKRQPKK